MGNLVTAAIVESAIKTGKEDREMERHRIVKSVRQFYPKLEAVFERVDTAHQGSIKRHEIETFVVQGLAGLHLPDEIAPILTPQRLCDCFDMLDIDKDGSVDMEEFIEGISTLALSDIPIDKEHIEHPEVIEAS